MGWVNDPELADVHALRRDGGDREITLIGQSQKGGSKTRLFETQSWNKAYIAALIASTKSVRSQLNPPSSLGERPKCP